MCIELALIKGDNIHSRKEELVLPKRAILHNPSAPWTVYIRLPLHFPLAHPTKTPPFPPSPSLTSRLCNAIPPSLPNLRKTRPSTSPYSLQENKCVDVSTIDIAQSCWDETHQKWPSDGSWQARGVREIRWGLELGK